MRIPQIIAAVWLIAASSSAAVDPLQPMPFRLSAHGDIVVAVTIRGAGPFRFLFDTGSSRSSVAADVAARLKLGVIAQTSIRTPAGEGQRPLVRLAGLSIGPHAPATVVAMVAPATELARSVAVDGIVGQDVLARFAYTIDYRKRHIIWHQATSSEFSGTRLPLESKGGRLMVSLPQRGDVRSSLRMIPDTGADRVVLFERPDGSLPAITPLDTAGLQTLSGTRVVRRVLVDRLDVGEIRLRDQIGVVVAVGEGSPLGDGLLPLHLFARVTFNGPAGYLAVEAY